MACKKPEINEKLLAYMENLLEAEEKKEAEAHISECSVCKDELSDLSEVNKLLADYSSKEKAKEPPCPTGDLLLKYSQQEGIPESVKAQITEHLKVCPICPRIVSLLKEHIRSYLVKEEYNNCVQLPDSLRTIIKEKYPYRETKEDKEALRKTAGVRTIPAFFSSFYKPALAFAAVLLILTGAFLFIKSSSERGGPLSTTTPTVAVTPSTPPSIAMMDKASQPKLKSEAYKPDVKIASPAPSPEENNTGKLKKEEAKGTESAKTKVTAEKAEPGKYAVGGAAKEAEGKSEMGITSSPKEEVAAAIQPEEAPVEKQKTGAKTQEASPPAATYEKTRTPGVSNAPVAPAPGGAAAQSAEKSSRKDLEQQNLQQKAQVAADKTLGKGRATVRLSVMEEAVPGREKKIKKVNVAVTLEKSATAEETNKVKEAIKNSLGLEAEEKENINFVFISK